jgi:hypothetical protein
MKSTKTKFEKIDLQELRKILPEAMLDGHNKRASDFPGKTSAMGKTKNEGDQKRKKLSKSAASTGKRSNGRTNRTKK